MPKNNQFFIVYFPYLSMRDSPEIDFGFLKIWNFNQLKEKYIPDEKIRSKIEEIFNMYQTFFSPVKDIGVVSIGNTDFRIFTEEEKEKIRLAELILFLSFLSKNNTIEINSNTGHRMATSDNFVPIYQNFNLKDKWIAEMNGYIVPIMHGGLEIDKIKYYRPGYVLSPMRFELDKELFNALLKLRTEKPLVFKKVMNATELFFESYYNSPTLSKNARILLQASAFEILLNLPKWNKRKGFRKIVEKETFLPGEKKYAYYSKKSGKKIKEYLTLKGIWADSFYMLRNHIIHGAFPSNREFFFRGKQIHPLKHTLIAFLFFIFFVKKQINKSLRQEIFTDEIIWKKWYDDSSGQDREEFVYDPFSLRKIFERYLRRRAKKNRLSAINKMVDKI